MANELPAKVAFRAEHSDSAPGDRAQRLAQQVAAAHEQTKAIVAALMNSGYVALAADSTTTSAVYAQLLSLAITTVLDTSFLDIHFTACGGKLLNAGNPSFRVVVDGVVAKGVTVSVPLNFAFNAAIVVRVPVTIGAHTVSVDWATNVTSTRINAASVVEEHANLLVQEAP